MVFRYVKILIYPDGTLGIQKIKKYQLLDYQEVGFFAFVVLTESFLEKYYLQLESYFLSKNYFKISEEIYEKIQKRCQSTGNLLELSPEELGVIGWEVFQEEIGKMFYFAKNPGFDAIRLGLEHLFIQKMAEENKENLGEQNNPSTQKAEWN